MESEPLAAACELAFSVARDGKPEIDAPVPMENFLYVAQLPRRAITVAQQVLDDDPDFRARVATAATEDQVGRAGYLWLTRPDGWSEEFATLSDHVPPEVDGAAPSFLDDEQSTTDDDAAQEAQAVADVAATPPPPVSPNGPDAAASGDSIESELAGLRDLVGKLAEERRQVSSEVAALSSGAGAEQGSSMSAQVQSLHDDLRSARSERDDAQEAKELAILRQAQLEDEIAELRRRINWFEDERAGVQETLAQAEQQVESVQGVVRDLETQRDDLDTKLNDLNNDLTNLTTERETLDARVNELTGDISNLTSERDTLDTRVNALTEDLSGMASERDELSASKIELTGERDVLDARVNELTGELESVTSARDALDTRVNELTGDLASMTSERDNLTHALEEAAVERARLESQLASSTSEAATLTTQLAALHMQRSSVDAELVRLNDEVAADAVNRQSQIDALTAQVSEVKAERDVLATQLEETRSILAAARNALQELTRSMDGELDRLEGAVDQSAQTHAGMEDTLTAATSSLDALGAIPPVALGDTSLLAENSFDVSTLVADDEAISAATPADEDASPSSFGGAEVTHVDFAGNGGTELVDTAESDDLDEVSGLVSETVDGFEPVVEAVPDAESTEAAEEPAETEESPEAQDVAGAEAADAATDSALKEETAQEDVSVQDATVQDATVQDATVQDATVEDVNEIDVADASVELDELDAVHEEVAAAVAEGDESDESAASGSAIGAVAAGAAGLFAGFGRRKEKVEEAIEEDTGSVLPDAAEALETETPETGAPDTEALETETFETEVFDPDALQTEFESAGEVDAEFDTDADTEAGEPDAEAVAAEELTADAEVPSVEEMPVPAALHGSRREVIIIPDELSEDPVAAARHVVNTADVVLLVDGDGVAQMGWPNLDSAGNRDALVSYLSILAGGTGVAPDVVLDRDVQNDPLPQSRAVRVRLTDEGGSVNAVLLSLIDSYPEEWPVVVVSNDVALTEDAAAKGATILDNGQLLDLFISY